MAQQEVQVNCESTIYTHELNNHKGIITDMWLHYNSRYAYLNIHCHVSAKNLFVKQYMNCNELYILVTN